MLSIEIYVWLAMSVLLLIIIFEGLIVWLIKKIFAVPYNMSRKVRENISLKELKKELTENGNEATKDLEEDSSIDNERGEIKDEKLDETVNAEDGSEKGTEEDKEVTKKVDGVPVVTTEEPTKKTDEKIKANIDNELTKRKVDRLLIEADRFKNKGDVDNYEKKLVECLSLVPDEPVVLDSLSDLYLNLGKDKKAFPLLKKLIQKDVNNHKAIWNLSKIYLNNSEMDTSLLLINKALELKEDNPKYWITKAEIVYNKDDIESALECAQSALKLRPENVMYIEGVAMLYEELGDKTRSKKYRLKILDIEPNYDVAREKLTE